MNDPLAAFDDLATWVSTLHGIRSVLTQDGWDDEQARELIVNMVRHAPTAGLELGVARCEERRPVLPVEEAESLRCRRPDGRSGVHFSDPLEAGVDSSVAQYTWG